MPSTPTGMFAIPAIPSLPSPSSSRVRGSLNTSFSFGPQALVDSFNASNSAISPRPPTFALDPNRSILGHSPRGARGGRSKNKRPHPLANDTTDVFNNVSNITDLIDDEEEDEDEGEDEGEEWDTIDRMRLWRHDALMQHLYDTAAFWGDKIVSWTNDPNDAFWLAQTYFMTHQYSRAETLLTRPFHASRTRFRPSGRETHANMNGVMGLGEPDFALAGTRSNATANANAKGKERASGDLFPRLPVGPAAMIDVAADGLSGVSRLVDMSVACRYLCAQCLARQGRWRDALEMLGEANPFKTSARSGPGIRNSDGGIKIEASMCHLRGLLMLKINRGEQAKTCFMEALALDVKCYDSFEQLVGGEMLMPDEEWEFVHGLAYKQQAPDDAEFVRLMYVSRLRKYKHAEEHARTRRQLVDEFGLADNPDVLWSFADALYAQFRWADCFRITERILGLVSVHTQTMPLHIACMYHLKHLHSKLFILAHELVEKEPESAISWYAVGVWYMAQSKWADARTYFSKTSLMDPRFSPSWIAYAHTFSLEKEHEQAIVAYSSCARSYTGSHLPLLFVGMENIMLSNHAQADEALNAASLICDGDPLLVNERGVMRFNHGDYAGAAKLFEEAIAIAQVSQGSQSVWSTTYLNLGTCCRKLGRYEDAKRAYKRVLEIHPLHPTGLAFLGMTCHLQDEIDEAILHYHEALSVDPINHHVLELLNLALEANADLGSERVRRPRLPNPPMAQLSGIPFYPAKGVEAQSTSAERDVDMSAV